MKTFEDVLFRFDQIIENSIEDSSVLGYFPILYREVTKEIEVQLTTGLFSNPTKVKNFTIRFANKYFEVYDRDFERQCWNLALNANDSVLVFQHILLGINAHINFDLPVTVGEIFTYDNIFDFQYDFNQINKILTDKVFIIQKRLNKINFILGVFDTLAQNRDEQIAIFSLYVAYSFAWNNAVKLAQLKHKEKKDYTQKIDQKVTIFGRKVLKKPFGFFFPLNLFKFFENISINNNLNILLGN